ncbi:MAG: GIY-YIG nuclease family protein [Candidatus Omnitrophica bacterium]|jgi:putative endonuclease|nr:GIY-YIG nuclease family protein [Candidatus Omnitrophota bacterium]
MFYVYALWSKEDNKFYVGYTVDLERRIKEHSLNKVHTTQRMHSPRLIFFEAFLSEQDARRREGYFKTTKGRKALRLILRDSLII